MSLSGYAGSAHHPRRTASILAIAVAQICLPLRIEGGDSRRVVPGLMLILRSAIVLVPVMFAFEKGGWTAFTRRHHKVQFGQRLAGTRCLDIEGSKVRGLAHHCVSSPDRHSITSVPEEKAESSGRTSEHPFVI